MRLKLLFAAITLLAANLVSTAQAAPVTYTLTGTISGSFNLQPFTDATFVWFMIGDTDQRQKMGDGLFGVPAQTVILDIGKGISVVTPVDKLFAVSGAPNFATFAFTDSTETTGIGFTAPELATYDGTTSRSPISVALNGTFLLTTLQGTLFIESMTGAMFDAVVSPKVSGVPEPLTLSLFGAGLAGAAGLRRRNKAIS